jgi:hypothetical protein
MEAEMPSRMQFHCPLRLDFEIRERARKTGRTVSDTILGAVERGLGVAPPEMPAAIVDVAERGEKGRAVAAYLSPPLSKAITRLADAEQRSTSWTMRLLIREALRSRGLLPPAAGTVAELK